MDGDLSRPLAPTEIAAMLHGLGQGLSAEMAGLPATVARWHPAAGEWCVLEVVGHLIEAERRGFAGRIREILDRPGLRLDTWDQGAVSQSRRDCHQDPARLAEEFRRLREESVALVRGLGADDLTRGGEHPKVGHLTVQDLLHEWLHHDRNHTRQLLANVQAFAWPHMGNAQRFSSA